MQVNIKYISKLRLLPACILIAFGFQISSKAVSTINFRTVSDELEHMTISSIAQDQDGFIWLGSWTGLSRFDGINLNYYQSSRQNSASLSNNIIHTLLVDSKGRLWVGTDDGLNCYNKELDNFERISMEGLLENPTDNLIIKAILETSEGKILLGTHYYGLIEYDPSSGTYQQMLPVENIEGFGARYIEDLFTDSQDRTWIATRDGLFLYDKAEPHYAPPPAQNSAIFKGFVITSLIEDKLGNLWAGTHGNGILVLSPENEITSINTNSEPGLSNNHVLAMERDRQGRIWIGTENGGLNIYSDFQNKTEVYTANEENQYSISGNSIWSLYRDANDRIWAGLYSKGINVYDPYYFKFNNLVVIKNDPGTLRHKNISSFSPDEKGNLWIAYDGGGIDYLNRSTHRIEATALDYPILNDMAVMKVLLDSRKHLWIATWAQGLYELNTQTGQLKHHTSDNTQGAFASENIFSIAEDHEGTIWFGTFGGGLVKYNYGENKFERLIVYEENESSFNIDNIWSVFIDHKDHLWAGTMQGLLKIEKDADGRYIQTRYQHDKSKPESLPGNRILSVFADSKQRLWIGTEGGGLSRLEDESGIFTTYTTENGLPDNVIKGILEDKNGDIWITSSKGICRFDPEIMSFQTFKESDGLLSNNFNINSLCLTEDGFIYLGGMEGINYFRPDDLISNPHKPSVQFTGFFLYNEEMLPGKKGSPLTNQINTTDKIVLNHDQSVFTIEFIGLDYTRPQHHQYKYYLEGFEDSWNEVGPKRSATYTSLMEGTYRFKVVAANSDGVWSQEVRTLEIVILPPWWRTRLALAGYIILLLILFGLLAWLLYKRVLRRQKAKMDILHREQEEKLMSQRLQFFTNISHEFRTPLTLIINPLKDILKGEKKIADPEIDHKFKVIYKNASRLNRLIDELMDFRKLQFDKLQIKPLKNELTAFLSTLGVYFSEEAIAKEITFELDLPNEPVFLYFDERMLEKVFFNLISNAFKVTEPGGKIKIDILRDSDLENSSLIGIRISDSGPGLTPGQIEKIFDRFYQIDKLNKTYYSSSGIGLALAKALVDMHKGEISVESTPGEGAQFIVWLQSGTDHFAEEELQHERQKKSKSRDIILDQTSTEIVPEEQSKTGTSLLLVEDNPELRSYLKGELSKHFKIVEAKNGKEGIELGRKHLPGIIVSDVIMPEVDGYQLCKQFKEDLRTSHIPIILLTAKGAVEDQVQGMESGADGYIVKPFHPDLLLSKINQLLKSRQVLIKKYSHQLTQLSDEAEYSSLDQDFLSKVSTYILENISDPELSVEKLGDKLALSRSQLYRKIKALTGFTATEYIRNIRLEQARKLIQIKHLNISEAAYETGFSSPSYFTKCYRQYFGSVPSAGS